MSSGRGDTLIFSEIDVRRSSECGLKGRRLYKRSASVAAQPLADRLRN